MSALPDSGDWMREHTRSPELRVVEAEIAIETPQNWIADPRTRILTRLLAVLCEDDRVLLESSQDGGSIASLARLQGVGRSTLGHRLVVLTDWLVYCVPIAIRIEPLLDELEPLSQQADQWWRGHTGARALAVARLEKARPDLVLDHALWTAPRRRPR